MRRGGKEEGKNPRGREGGEKSKVGNRVEGEGGRPGNIQKPLVYRGLPFLAKNIE